MPGGFAYLAPYTLSPETITRYGYLPASLRSLPSVRLGRRLSGRSSKAPATLRAQHHSVRQDRCCAGTGISTRCPSTTPVGLALGPDLPRADEPGPGTLGHSADGFLTRHSLLMPAFSLACSPRLGHPAASPHTQRSPTHPRTWTEVRYMRECHSFGG